MRIIEERMKMNKMKPMIRSSTDQKLCFKWRRGHISSESDDSASASPFAFDSECGCEKGLNMKQEELIKKCTSMWKRKETKHRIILQIRFYGHTTTMYISGLEPGKPSYSSLW